MNTVVIQRTARPIRVRSNDPGAGLGDATWYGNFTVLGDPGRVPEMGTWFAMAHDGEKLLVVIRAEESDSDRVDASKVDVQREVWSQDHVEVFVDAGGRGRTCIQLGATCRGNVAELWRRGLAELYEPDLGSAVVASQDQRGWWVRITVPLASLDFGAASNAWRVNVDRVRVVKGQVPQLSTYAPIDTGVFYHPQSFVTAQVEGLDADDYRWEVKLLGAVEVVPTDGRFRLRQRIRIANLTDRSRTVAVHGRLAGQTTPATLSDGDFASGQQREQLFEADLPTEDFGRLYVTIEDRQSSKILRRCMRDPDQEAFSWKEHRVLYGDGRGGFTVRPGQYQFIARCHGEKVVPYGLAQMDNGQIILVGSTKAEAAKTVTVTAFSDDGGATWSDYRRVEHACSTPMMLTYLGRGDLAFRSSWQRGGPHYHFSHDYGRTWPEKIPVPSSPDGLEASCEGSTLVDRDENGIATLIGETGQTMQDHGYCRGYVHWSRDGGRTWQDFSYPEVWNWQDTYAGRVIERGCGEGAMVRAANGWIVVALRMDGRGRYLKYEYDQFEGTGVSISKDDGRSWSPVQRVCEGGRMHANLVRLPNDDLIMTVVRRMDIRGGRLASYRRGCDALVSHDHGLTWNLDEMIVIDDWPHHDPDQWYGSVCGHLFSAVLDDGSVLTGYSKHALGGVLIRWQP